MLWSWGLLVCHSFICVAQFLIYFIFYFKSHFLCGVFCTTQFKITSLFLAFRSLPPLVLFIIVLVIAWIGSVAQFSLTLCDPKNCRTPGIPVHHKLLESTQTHVHWVDAIQPSHPLSTPSLPALIFPTIRVFSNESSCRIRWPTYWSFSFNISPSNEYSGLISFRMDWLDLLAVQGTLKGLLQHHSSKASILLCSAFFTVQLSHPYMTTGKTIALTRQTFVV